MNEIEEINIQQHHINKIDELNSMVEFLVIREDYEKLRICLNRQLESLQKVTEIQKERKTRMEELSESLEKQGVETEVVKHVQHR